MTRTEIAGVAGVAETLLARDLLERLPSNLAPAPWSCTAEAVVWISRPSRAAREALPAGVAGRPVAVVGGMVRYESTPVGSYDEVFGIVAVQQGRSVVGHVAFMAVDSEASLVGGRTNWAMPKTLATFDGAVRSGTTLSATSADGVGPLPWSVRATPHATGPALPVRTRAVTRQEFPGARVGDSRMTGQGRIRPALVSVSVESGGTLPEWLRPGRHLGAVVQRSTFSLAEPTFG